MSTAMSIVRTLLGLLFDHTIGNIVRMIPIIRMMGIMRTIFPMVWSNKRPSSVRTMLMAVLMGGHLP